MGKKYADYMDEISADDLYANFALTEHGFRTRRARVSV